MAIYLDNAKEFRLNRTPFYLPFNLKNRRKGSVIFLLTPDIQSSINMMRHPLMINKELYKSYYIEKDINFVINEKSEVVIDNASVLTESAILEMSTKERNKIPSSEFGLEEERKYPLDSPEHVRSAIKLFGHCPEGRKAHLAKRIMSAAKKHGVEVDKNTEVYKYAHQGAVNESFGKITLYHGDAHKYSVLKPTSPMMGNRLEKAKWAIFFFTRSEPAEKYAMMNCGVINTIMTEIFPNTPISDVVLPMKRYEDKLKSKEEKKNLKRVVPESYYDKLRSLVIGKKVYVHEVELYPGQFGIGHSRDLEEYTAYKDVPVKSVKTLTITKEWFDATFEKASDDYCRTNKELIFTLYKPKDKHRPVLGHIPYLFYDVDDVFRPRKKIMQKIYDGEITPGEGDLQVYIDMVEAKNEASIMEPDDEEVLKEYSTLKQTIVTESGINLYDMDDGKTWRMLFPEAVDQLVTESNSTMLRKLLFNERIKNQKEAILVYDKVKQALPETIKFTYLNYKLYKEKNLFIDWAYYTESFFRNLKWVRDKAINLYFDFFTKFLTDKRLSDNGYVGKKTVLVPVDDWYNGKDNIWDFSKTINPISVIYRLFRLKTTEELKRKWKDLEFVFTTKKMYFRLNFQNFTQDNLPKFTMLLDKMCRGETDDVDFEVKDSKEVIAHKIIDRIEDSGIQINNLTGGTSKLSRDEVKALLRAPQPIDDKIEKPEKVKDKKEQNKALLVQKVQKSAEVSQDENEALKDMNNDNDSAWVKTLLIELQEDDGYKISEARSKRMTQGYNNFLETKLQNQTIEDILKKNATTKELPVDNIPIDSINEEWKDVKYTNFSKSYDLKADILSTLGSLNNKSTPIIITGLDITDNSTTEDYIETWTIKMEDVDGKRFTVKLDIPKFINGRFMRLRGNYKTINGQILLLPIIKTSDDTAQIVSNYNKIFIRRISPSNGMKTTRDVSMATKLFRTYDGKDITVVEGDNGFISSKYILPMEYVDLSKNYSKIMFKDGSYISFNQDDLRKLPYKNPKAKDNPNCFPFLVENGKVECAEIENSFGEILRKVLTQKLGENVFDGIKPDKRLSYSEASILSADIPVIVCMAYSVGLQTAMNKAGITYKFQEKRPSSDQTFIKFNDGYLVYTNTLEASLLMNGLYSCNTEDYSIKDINKKNMWLDFLDNYGGRIKADGLDNFYDCMFDPITQEICRIFDLPDDYITALAYASDLLVDNDYNKHTDLSGNRIRTNEIVAGYVYKTIAKAYGDYQTMRKRNKKDATISCKQSAVIDNLMLDPTMSDLSILNPQSEAEDVNTLSFKGLSGMNSDRSYSLDKRTYDESMFGIIGTSTGFSGNTGLTRQATINANIKGVRGMISTPDPKDVNTLNGLTIHEAMNPWCTTHDDPIRVAMGFIQSTKHPMRVKKAMPNLVTTGMDEAIPYITSDFFSYKFRGKRGKILDVTDRYILVKDEDTGTVDYVSLEERTEKNSDGGFYVTIKLDSCVRKGQIVRNNDILAFDKTCYKPQVGHTSNTKGVTYCIGAMCKLGIMPTDEGYEDSSIIDEYLAEAMTSSYVVKKEKILSKDTNVYNVVSKGQEIKEGDPLIIFQNAFEEEDANALLRYITDDDTEAVTDLGRIHIRSKISGWVQDIKIYRTCDLSELSPSLKKLVMAYEKQIKEDKKLFEKHHIEGSQWKLPPDYKLEPIGKLKAAVDSVLIEFYIKCEDKMGIGDKLIYNNSIKGVIKDIMPKGSEPRTKFRPDEPINALLSTGSVNARMVASIILNGSINKCMIELDRKCKELLGIKWKNLDEM